MISMNTMILWSDDSNMYCNLSTLLLDVMTETMTLMSIQSLRDVILSTR